ncbi:MAG: MATE family efflux transporter [Rikenellaceae bacterium]
MNREILRIALPNIISNITVPIMGIASTAIAGRCGDDSAYTIGQLAIGVSIFNMIYWNCNFIRMGTSGLTAQAFGAGDFAETTRMLIRSIGVSLILGLVILLFKSPLAYGSVELIGGGDLALEYVKARLWAVPAGILLFGFHGWFTGMQNGTYSMFTALTVNILHIALSLYLALARGMGVVGIAYASVVAQWVGVLIASALLYLNFRGRLVRVSISEVLSPKMIRKFFSINSDIIIRTICIVSVYTFFTRASARMENEALLAINTMLLQLFTLYSYMTDGFAYAAEALTGRFIGARDGNSLRRAIIGCILWSTVVSVVFVGIYLIFWRDILSIFIGGSSDVEPMLSLAGEYIWWIITIPIMGAFPFLMDGVMVGANFTKVIRNSMLVSTVIYFSTFLIFEPIMGNDALWLAFMLFMFLRGGVQYLMTSRLRDIFGAAG